VQSGKALTRYRKISVASQDSPLTGGAGKARIIQVMIPIPALPDQDARRLKYGFALFFKKYAESASRR
jgi:hypothetical protein